jgi:hypothetical protein
VDYTNTHNEHFIARPITTHDIQAESFEVSPSLLNLITREQVAGNSTMIEDLNKSIASISCDIKGLQTQAAGLDKALPKLADSQATLLSMSAGKPQAPPVIGMNSIVITENTPLTLEETLEELKNYPEFLLPFVSQLICLGEEVKEVEEDE